MLPIHELRQSVKLPQGLIKHEKSTDSRQYILKNILSISTAIKRSWALLSRIKSRSTKHK